MAVIDNVYFYYARLKVPTKCYDKTKGKEYTVDVLVSRKQAIEWNKLFKKQKAKELSAAEFEEIYGAAAPFEIDEEAGEQYYIIKAKRPAQMKDGSELPEKYKPKVFMKGANGKLKDVTQDKLVGNGSKGALSYDPYEVTGEFAGTYARLKGVRVDNLIEYVGNDGFDELGAMDESDAADELDASSESSDESDTPPATKKAEETPTKPARKARTAKPEADEPF